jgi:integrase
VGKTKLKFKFTKKAIEDLEVREQRYNVFDSETRGLGIVVHPSGQKTFFHLRKVQGWPERTTLGVFPEFTLELARGKASDLNGKLSKWKSNDYEGPNPVSRPKKISNLGQVFDHYIEHHLRGNAKNPDHAVQYAKWQFDSYLSSWRNRPLGTIRREHVRELHAEIAKKHGGVTANRTITFLRTLFNHAIDPDVTLWDGVNPCAKPKKFLSGETGRDRTLLRGEFRTFFKELSKERNPDLRHAVLLALFTGQRRGSILRMRWPDLDLRSGLWRVTTLKGKKKKSSEPPKPHIVPLIDEATTLLKKRVRVDGSEWVFAGRNGALTTLKKPWTAFIKRTGIVGLTFHDLRRTLATQEGETGASREAIQKTLGHTEDSTATDIYDRSERRAEVRAAMSDAARAMLAAGKTSRQKLLAAPRA